MPKPQPHSQKQSKSKQSKQSSSKGKIKHYTISGINPIVTLLENDPARVMKVMLAENVNSARAQQALKLIEQHQISIQKMSSADFNQQFDGVTQGIAAEVLLPRPKSFKELQYFLKSSLPESGLLLILDQIQDPHNLGAVLRTADAAGVNAVIMSEKNTVPLNATVSKVASGGAESVPIFRVTNLSRAIEAIKEAGIWLIGTTDHAEQSIYDSNLTGSVALVMGAEGSGMRRLTEESCDYLVKLPMQGVVNSLNVSVATGICLYEINRQRL